MNEIVHKMTRNMTHDMKPDMKNDAELRNCGASETQIFEGRRQGVAREQARSKQALRILKGYAKGMLRVCEGLAKGLRRVCLEYAKGVTCYANHVLRFTVVLLVLLLGTVGVKAQTANGYVIYYNGYYLAHDATTGAVITNATNTFDPSTCLWTISGNNIRPVSSNGTTVLGSLYLRPRSGNNTYSLNTNTSTNYNAWSQGVSNDGQPYYSTGGWNSTNYYLRLNGTTWQVANNNSNRGTIYSVTKATVTTTSTPPTISGDDVIAKGNYSYSASGASYQQGGYTNYQFNNTDFYFNGNTAFSPTPANVSYLWSVSGYSNASVNSSGVVTVSSILENDATLTLMVTATFSDGNPAVTGSPTLTDTKTVTVGGYSIAPPVINRSVNTISVSAAIGATVYYTTDGTDPETSATRIPYTGSFDLTSSGTTIRATATRDGEHYYSSTGGPYTMMVATPIISIDQSGNVTITCATDGATIRYTTGATSPADPTSSTGTIGSSTTLTNLQYIKARAFKDGYDDSEVVEDQYVTSGTTSDNKVILNDREPHSWSYYSDSSTPAQLHSLNPADVKITYKGNGNNVSTSNDAAPALNTFTATSTTVAVGIDAPENTFIYYKTLERTSGTEYGSASYSYTTIPNPFSVRPTNGSGDTRWRGFYAWRITKVENGAISNKQVGDTINAESPVRFIPSGEYGMEVELEALWARAYVGSGYQASVGYERNFVVGGAAVNYPATYSALYPNGSTDGGTTLATSVPGTYDPGGARTLSYDTKFEYINLTGNRTYTANNHYLCFGRGISTANNAGTVQGIGEGKTDLNYTLRVESGQYSAFCFVRSGTNTTVSGRYLVKAIMGCDYDRATNTNNKLSVSANSSLFFAQTVGFTGSSNKDQKTFDCVFKSGTYQSDQWDDDQNGTNGYLHIAYLGQNSAQGNTYPGVRCVTVEGGDLGGMCGGRGVSSNSNNSTYMTPEVITFDLRIKGGTFHGGVFGGAADNPSIGSRRFIMTGGEIWGWLAGGCNGTGSQTGSGATDGNSYIYVGGYALVGGDHAMCLQDTNGGQVFGAGRGLNDTRTSSVNYSYVAIADEAVICNNNNTANNPVGGNVYGGSYNGTVVTEANVYILGGTVQGGVYGGSYGNATDVPAAKVTMTGGLVKGGVYGGSNSKGNVGAVTMHIDGGTVGDGNADSGGNIDGVFGGGLGNNTRVTGSVNLTLGENVGDEGVIVNGDVYGGSAKGKTNGNNSLTTGAVTNVTMNAGTINGSLYGGGLGTSGTGGYAADVYGPVAVKVYGGSVKKTSQAGSGGVYGANNINGAPQSSVTVDIYGTDDAPAANEYALYAVYGGGNQADYIKDNYPTVTVHNCDNSIEYVYGGGNAAAVKSTNVTIWGGDVIGNVFGGGNGTDGAANVNGNASTKIYGGTILNVYGGSNSAGTISGTISVEVESKAESTGGTPCTMDIGSVYGGGNRAASNAGTISIGCTGDNGHIDNVYGGANAANISGNISLKINGGDIGNVFGGNNTDGDITGTITVTVGDDPKNCGVFQIENVYGGGNLADYTAPTATPNFPSVNIHSGTITGDVYGGGLGVTAVVDGNPQVTLYGGTINRVFGGGSQADVKGSVVVQMPNASTATVGDLYGGGALADTNTDSNKTTTVSLLGGTVNNVYGGGLGRLDDTTNNLDAVAAIVGGDVTVTLDGSAVTGNIFGCNNINGTPKGHVKVWVKRTIGWTGHDLTAGKNDDTIDKGTGVYELAAVYGGGNMAAYEPTSSAEKTEVVIDGCDLTSIGYVYGGGNAASVPATDVTVNGTYEIGYLFGGGNGRDNLPNGDPNPGANVGYKANGTTGYGTGVAQVNVLGGTIHYVFGGSNTKGNVREEAVAYLDEANTCPLNIDEVYGGGNQAYMAGDAQIKLGCISYLKEIYGGAKAAPLGGDIELTITSGRFDRVFGGNNVSGNIDGSITVNIEETGCHPIVIGQLYGGGNQAAYSVYGYDNTTGDPLQSGTQKYKDPQVNLKSFTSIGEVYGGGYGATAIVTGNPTVNVNVFEGINSNGGVTAGTYTYDVPAHFDADGNFKQLSLTLDGQTVIVPNHVKGKMGAIGTVFGGGNAAAVNGNTNVNVCTKEYEYIVVTVATGASVSSYYSRTGSGTTADPYVYSVASGTAVAGTTYYERKTVLGADIRNNVFGGGNAAVVTGNTNVTVGKEN